MTPRDARDIIHALLFLKNKNKNNKSVYRKYGGKVILFADEK
jgi:hypothetical protein